MPLKPAIDPEQWILDSPNDLISLTKWQRTVNLLAKLFDAPAGFLVQHTSSGYQVAIASEQQTNPYSAGMVVEPEANIFCRKIVETRQSLYVANATIDPCWDSNPEVHKDGFRSYLGVPVFWPNGKAFGTFCVLDYRETNYDDTYFELIEQLKDILEADLSLLELYLQMQKLAVTDPLTELNNRRGFSSLAQQRIRLAKRMGSRLGVFYLDIDKFKQINDTHGHAVGDNVLIDMAKAMRHCVRSSDVIGRMGGDEFVALVLIEQDSDFEAIATRFTEQFAQYSESDLPLYTVTIGYADVDLTMEVENILALADQDMYQHKTP
ncbi:MULTISPECIES: sensor domain-containing diguanylate cyclase [unclassified Agarivorans]|uniref:sensor domain-containing diguanylate cyclase n=1 Tax=unclassified Agarivorans TaxID=2636026 RepID=UPI0026E37EC2|nr:MULTISPECIES: sensor domain-containing diguanylate cyclase [unclassified Agarivorans]MDO6684199.1 sensor domain-containing diguanylate cyclase [Agarivorans sp. 3_MG-2023]MDO6714067.1 sensor domain-containing diguanylate cyclase [Agarivorans sp. 2_MG-2023]